MKTLVKLILMASIVTVWASCDKSKEDLTLEPKYISITGEELLNYYFTLVINEKNSLRILYFTKVGNQVQATMDNVQGRRVYPIDLKNNVLTFDADANGKKVYKFKLSKRTMNMSVTLSSSSYKNLDLDTVSLKHAQINKVSTAPEFRNRSFQFYFDLDSPSSSFFNFSYYRFLQYYVPLYVEDFSTPFYIISPGAWKGKSFLGNDCMGITVPGDSGRAKMWVQFSSSEKTYLATSYYDY